MTREQTFYLPNYRYQMLFQKFSRDGKKIEQDHYHVVLRISKHHYNSDIWQIEPFYAFCYRVPISLKFYVVLSPSCGHLGTQYNPDRLRVILTDSHVILSEAKDLPYVRLKFMKIF